LWDPKKEPVRFYFPKTKILKILKMPIIMEIILATIPTIL